MEKVNVLQKFSLFSEKWNPKIVGELNGQHLKLVKAEGTFVWHKHDNEDELFYIVKGSLNIEFRDKTILLEEGEFLVVPKGVEHRPVANEEVWILLFEPVATLNTGDIINENTKQELERI
ncbi:MAG TPA: cupin domain-containing protein [Flavisolibacter sp.]|nr:cupin domain-containing protein [Flavisolibacter sp.]